MAFNRPRGSFSFQQEQVAHPSSYSFDPSTYTTSTGCYVPSATPSASRSLSSFHPASSLSPFENSFHFSDHTSQPSTPTQQPYPYSQSPISSYKASVNPKFSSSQPFVDAQFDIFEWHVQNQSCVRYFLDHAQYSAPVQAVAAFVNIQLPFQRLVHPVLSSKPRNSTPGIPNIGMSGPGAGGAPSSSRPAGASGGGSALPGAFVTLVPYIRRLIATAFDFPAVLHGFFGDDWMAGIGPVLEAERRNYLFAAKSENWLKVKADYDMDESQTVPFLRPLQNVSEEEIVNAESKWSEWLAMQDWMLGPRAPGNVDNNARGPNIKREQD